MADITRLNHIHLVLFAICLCLFLVWGIGFLCVTLINLCALLGMVFIPLMRKAFYKRLLMFMVALGAGTLTGSSLLFLIPEVSIIQQILVPPINSIIFKFSTYRHVKNTRTRPIGTLCTKTPFV